MIEVRDVSFRYDAAEDGVRAAEAPGVLSGVSLTIADGEFLAIVGHNGSGKSTLAKHLNALLLPTAGQVLVDGMDTRDEAHTLEIRRRVGLVFQNPDNQLVTTIVEEDVGFGPENLGVPEEEIRARVREALELVGLQPERFLDKSPFDLSGGEKRRAALAGILAMRPKYLALDEPMAGLDPRGRRAILDMLERLRADTGCAVLMVSHSMDDVARHADRVAVLAQGRLCMLGPTAEVFARADELAGMGLAVPQAARLAGLLRARGLAAPADAVRPEALVDWVLGAYRARREVRP